MSAESAWGRIDDDGTVFVRTADGERQIGSWQAGDAAAGLRSTSGATRTSPPRSSCSRSVSSRAPATRHRRGSRRRAIKEQLPTVAAIGDLAALDARLDALLAAADARAGEVQAAREQARSAAVAAKEALIVEALRDRGERAPVEGQSATGCAPSSRSGS